MTTEQVQDTLNKIKADNATLAQEMVNAINQNDRPWLEGLAKAHREVLAVCNKAIEDCNAELATAEGMAAQA